MTSKKHNITEENLLLMEEYKKLDICDKKILQILTVAYHPMVRTNIISCLKKMKVKDSNRKDFSTTSILDNLQRLVDMSFITLEGGATGVSKWRCELPVCNLIARKMMAGRHFSPVYDVLNKLFPSKEIGGYYYHGNKDDIMRDIRHAFYTNNIEKLIKYVDFYDRKYGYLNETHVMLELIDNPFDPSWINLLSIEILCFSVMSIVDELFYFLTPSSKYFDLLMNRADEINKDNVFFGKIVFEFLMRGRMKEAHALLSRSEGKSTTLMASLDVVKGVDQRDFFNHLLKLIKKDTGKRKVFISDFLGIFYVLNCIKFIEEEDIKKLKDYLTFAIKNEAPLFAEIDKIFLNCISYLESGDDKFKFEIREKILSIMRWHPTIGFFAILTMSWIDRHEVELNIGIVEDFSDKLEKCGYMWMLSEMDEILYSIDSKIFASEGNRAEIFRAENDVESLVHIIKNKEPWELKLVALEDLCGDKSPAKEEPCTSRLIWKIKWKNKNPATILEISPIEQKLLKSGAWSKGRKVSLKRLSEKSRELPFVTTYDRNIIRYIHKVDDGWGYSYGLNFKSVPKALVEHPLIFKTDEPLQSVFIKGGEPELKVSQTEGKLKVLLHPSSLGQIDSGSVVIEESPNVLKVIALNRTQKSILKILGEKGLSIPENAKDRAIKTLSSVASVISIQSSIGDLAGNLKSIDGDPRIHLQLCSVDQGLLCSITIRPSGLDGPTLHPGKGGSSLIGNVNGEKVQIRRDLKVELKELSTFLEACPVISTAEERDGYQWFFYDPEDCLEFLLQIKDLQDSISVEWPQGKPIKVHSRVSTSNCSLKIDSDKDWFALSGEVTIDEDLVMSMVEIMDMVDKSSGNFIPIGEGEFLALTGEFRRRLEELHSFGQKKGDTLRLSPLVTPIIEEFSEKAGSLKSSRSWSSQLERLKKAESLEPVVSSTLTAELRDYQVDGFSWLAKLAQWGVGACLADDMGLGKTLQALALLLDRASNGPALVVAPTSVCNNWSLEALKFSPTLKILPFRNSDRVKTVEGAGAFDIVVTSYGLLQQEAELFASKEWTTIVLDEAQAIKNRSTQRSKAAMSLKSDFKMIVTGTPIENHLGELWNLFRFINPGLLGSQDRFNKTFALPIEKNGDRDARQRLKKLVRPFILRRTKNQVLSELPPRTDIRVTVQMSQEERNLYEALRVKALKNLEDEKLKSEPGKGRFTILAEITKLRRACCNPSLAMPEVPIESSKLESFLSIIKELKANGHKALVFSQFVDHLSILRKSLDDRGITYQYLDGSTPPKKRTEGIDAFQRGEGDCFLISLKAGGLGLNLTAADYVIHMDPWWNPAVEDQASDRAHRIGQTRPVTVYRLVTENSIEEKILELHGEKRDLANSLLEGTDSGARLDSEALLNLIREI